MRGAIPELFTGPAKSAARRLPRCSDRHEALVALEFNEEVEGRVRARTAELSAANELLKERLEEIQRLKKDVEEQAVRDALTGLYNRSAEELVRRGGVAMYRAKQEGRDRVRAWSAAIEGYPPLG